VRDSTAHTLIGEVASAPWEVSVGA
jgi:hypothetical protein